MLPASRSGKGHRVNLTPREREVLRHISDGMTTAEISAHLGISLWTVKDHVKSIRAKLQVGSMRELAALARDVGSE